MAATGSRKEEFSAMNDMTKDGERVVIFDTTLRDGEQSPGCSMNLEEKIQVAEVLEQMGVDVIEAGFPIASRGDFEAVSEIAGRIKESSVAGLARATAKDIERAGEALKHAARPRIHTFISTSPLHMKFKLQMEPEAVHQAVMDSVSHARNLCDARGWHPH
jgi:2-isopropylmalate synthase